jgi:glycosyltransferase involved in cell wall biosynthesis
MTPTVALAHDYFTQRGGAERVALAMARTFPGAAMHTALIDPAGTYPEVAELDVRESFLGRVPGLRRRHRVGLAAFPAAFGRMRPDADVVLCSSSGWAHGIGGEAPRIVYCHTPARWLYRPDDFAPGAAARLTLAALGPALRRWDQRHARSAARYFTNAPGIAIRIAETYGIEAEVLTPPPGLDATGPQTPVASLEPGFVLCVSRLLPYKHVELLVLAARELDRDVVIVGEGPEADRLHAMAPPTVRFLPRLTDPELRWLYGHASLLAAPAEEDYGLTPVEAAAFGVPTVARAAGGHLVTVVDGVTGSLVPSPTAPSLAAALRDALEHPWDGSRVRAHADDLSEPAFARRLREVVEEVLG